MSATNAVEPVLSRNVFSDIRSFLLRRPLIPTLMEYTSEEERRDYSSRIIQRLHIDTKGYAILNVHKIGIAVPARYVFEELLSWDEDFRCWPNHLAKVERIEGRLEHIHILLFGRKTSLFGLKNGFLGLTFIPLFQLDAIKVQAVPSASDLDNARYLLYECSGGYPIGIFTMFVRSSIAEWEEVEQSQLFFGVGFNFYGREDWPKAHPINRLWETIHNRVTANIMNMFKQMCEAKFQAAVEGQSVPNIE